MTTIKCGGSPGDPFCRLDRADWYSAYLRTPLPGGAGLFAGRRWRGGTLLFSWGDRRV